MTEIARKRGIVGHIFKTNLHGFRDSSFETKNQRSHRIMILGRSTSMGDGVPQKKSWPQILKTILSDSYTLYNLSLSGYKWTQIKELSQLFIPSLQPKTIIIPFYLAEWDIAFPINSNSFNKNMEFQLSIKNNLGHFFIYHALKQSYREMAEFFTIRVHHSSNKR